MLMHQLADYAVKEQTSKLPPEVVHHAKRAIIDWHAALFPGSVVAPATILEQALAEDLDRGDATLASGRRATLRAAALINGAAAHAVEVDDIYRDAGYHPGAPTIAAALAAAQAYGADGDTLLRAVIVGYEVSTRIGEAVMPAHYKYWHTTGTVGCFGTAAAVATVLGCDRDQFANALGCVGTFASGLQQAFLSESMVKPLHSGHAAEVGAMAAMAAKKGLIGAHDILEGPVGFGQAMSGDCDWSKATKDLGTDYHITRMTFKNHCCCGHIFAPIDGALHLQSANKLSHDQIKRVSISTYKAGVNIVGNYNAASELEARFSAPYVVANALVHGSVRLNAFTPERLNDPVTRDLMQRVVVSSDPELSAGYPGRRAAHIEIETTRGQVLKHFQPTRKGDPDAPHTDAELNDKYAELAAPVIGAAAAAELLDKLWRLEHSRSLDFYSRKPNVRAAG
jgi:2-methylcitrate dehydratase PrpD